MIDLFTKVDKSIQSDSVESSASIQKHDMQVQTDDDLLFNALQEMLYNSATPSEPGSLMSTGYFQREIMMNPEYSQYFNNIQNWINRINNSSPVEGRFTLQLNGLNIPYPNGISPLTTNTSGPNSIQTNISTQTITFDNSTGPLLANLSDINSLNNYIQYVIGKYEILGEYYKDISLDKMIFNYTIVNKEHYVKMSQIHYNESNEVLKELKVQLTHLPNNMDFQHWGTTEPTKLLFQNKYKIINIPKFIEQHFIVEPIYDETNQQIKTLHVQLKTNLLGDIITSWTDTINPPLDPLEENPFKLDNFTRVIGNKSYHYKEGLLYFYEESLNKLDYITPLNENKKYLNNFATLDIETYLEDNIHKPYLICIHDGKRSVDYYLNPLDINGESNMFKDALYYLFTRKFNGKNIYIHNSSNFDLVFLLKYLVEHKNITKFNPIVKDGKFISLEVFYNGGYKLTFLDSYLLLPSSLYNLCKAFKIEQSKDIFPHKFASYQHLEYLGKVPEYNYFDQSKISLEEYNIYKKRYYGYWSFKKESRLYCQIDCKSLYQIISKFSEEIFN